MAYPNTSETVYMPDVDLQSFYSSATVVFVAVYLILGVKAILKFTVSTFDLQKFCEFFFHVLNVKILKSICGRAIWTSDRMDKSINLNPVGNTALQTHHVDSTLKRRENCRFHVVSTWNPRGVFVG